MKRASLWFVGPGLVEIREEPLDPPGAGQVLVQVHCSAISPGTEMLFFRGMVPEELALDRYIVGLQAAARYPFQYGYSSVGQVLQIGPEIPQDLLGKRVFCFHPHESAFLARPEELIFIPEGVDDENAVFLPNMETAVNFCQDAAPLLGEAAGIFGLGIVGLLTSAVFAQFPLGFLAGFDPLPGRRLLASSAIRGLTALDPNELDAQTWQSLLLQAGSADGLDVVVECSGAPQALSQAIALAGFESRVLIGSWYGKKVVELNLGGAFHRSRIRLVSSQVSTIAGALAGRWSKARRLGAAWSQIRRIRPAQWISHRFSIAEAAQAYALLADNRQDALQVLFEYPS